MKFLWLVVFLICLVGIYFKSLVWWNSEQPILGLVAHKLQPCGEKPNCECSEIYPDKTQISAYKAKENDVNQLWQDLISAVATAGGKIVSQEVDYLHATFTSKFFGFTDDFELRKNTEDNQVEVRSASRVGHSDLGANAKRIEQLRSLINAS
jgi:uncharacterized protein (DUF1499 family)